MPSPPRNWMPTSRCLPKETRPFAPMPPPVLELLNAPEAALVDPVSAQGLAGIATVGNGVVPSPARVIVMAPFAAKHGNTRSRNVLMIPKASKCPHVGSRVALTKKSGVLLYA